MNHHGYPEKVWNEYSSGHQSVFPSIMIQANQEAASRMKGDILDIGCGSAKVAPFVLEQAAVNSYTGIDYAEEMVSRARWMLQQFPGKPSEILSGKIEELTIGTQFDACLSINSYYAWDNPLSVLKRIYTLLHNNGVFVLVTPNKSIDMRKLLRTAEKEMIAHPHYKEFCAMNIAFCDNSAALFVDMDELIQQTQSAGFRTVEAHQQLYLGGLNFLCMKK